MNEAQAIKAIREKFVTYSNDEVELDDKPKTSEGDDGWWVQAWLWIRKPDEEEVDHD